MSKSKRLGNALIESLVWPPESSPTALRSSQFFTLRVLVAQGPLVRRRCLARYALQSFLLMIFSALQIRLLFQGDLGTLAMSWHHLETSVAGVTSFGAET